MTLRPLGPFAVVSVEPIARHGWRMAAKRGFDLCLAIGGLIVLSPVLAATALAVRLDSRGPVLFRQVRVGQDGRPFVMYKFRSMVTDAELVLPELEARNHREGPLFKMVDDPRVTRVGRFIRRTSIDELPQLWNVVNATMSIVGPRPALPREAERWPEGLRQRLRVKPGITGYWQVTGRDSESFELYSRLDLYYVDNWSLITDLAIVLKTLPTLVQRRSTA
jgi:exopolysaccharide biosynthesis polyprenyl glycosylphosphotransferase